MIGTLRFARNLAGERKAVFARKIDVERDQCDGVLVQMQAQFRAVLGLAHAVALKLEILAQQRADLRFVVNNKNLDRIACGHGVRASFFRQNAPPRQSLCDIVRFTFLHFVTIETSAGRTGLIS